MYQESNLHHMKVSSRMIKMTYCLVIVKKNLRKMLQSVVQDYQTKRLTFNNLSLSSIRQLRFLKYFVWMVRLEYENWKEDNFEQRSFHEFPISCKFLRKLFPQHFFLFYNFNSQKIVFAVFFRFQPFCFCWNNWVNLNLKMKFRPN